MEEGRLNSLLNNPTPILKECATVLVPVVTMILFINLSLSIGNFLTVFRLCYLSSYVRNKK